MDHDQHFYYTKGNTMEQKSKEEKLLGSITHDKCCFMQRSVWVCACVCVCVCVCARACTCRCVFFFSRWWRKSLRSTAVSNIHLHTSHLPALAPPPTPSIQTFSLRICHANLCPRHPLHCLFHLQISAPLLPYQRGSPWPSHAAAALSSFLLQF